MKLLRTISALLLAFLVLLSSTSFLVGMHFCMGEVRSIALFSKAEECMPVKAVCPKHERPDCCADQVVMHEAQEFKSDVAQYEFENPVVVLPVAPMVLIAEVIPATTDIETNYPPYDPPLVSTDLTVDLQVFLI